MWKIAIIVLVVLLPFMGMAQVKTVTPEEIDAAVETCVQTINDRFRLPSGLFSQPPMDAYRDKSTNVVWTRGTPQEIFLFDKCMNERGIPMEDLPAKKGNK